jgi:hypothetical protein
MPKKKVDEEEEELEEEAVVSTTDLNEFLGEEAADEGETDRVQKCAESLSSTTKLLSALEYLLSVEYEDEIGAALVKEFRVRFARHEITTQ